MNQKVRDALVNCIVKELDVQYASEVLAEKRFELREAMRAASKELRDPNNGEEIRNEYILQEPAGIWRVDVDDEEGRVLGVSFVGVPI